jgi:aryl-alcohol dehydrogenase-like predicted oxidoreductase
MKSETITAAASGTFALGGDLPVHRLGFGAMRLTGPGVWGPPSDKKEALAVLRRAVELQVNFIDTAESYGPHVSEELIAAALHPYPHGLVIATKGGLDRPGPHKWQPSGRPERLREELEGSLRRLRLDRIDLWQLHRIDPAVPEEKQFETMQQFQREGKVRHLGLSEASVEQIQRARAFFPVVSVQNRYNLIDREWDGVVDYCQREGLGFIPWFPLQVGKLAEKGGALLDVARELGATPAQVGLAWLLRRSPTMLPIPGTSRVSHLEENVAAAALQLSPEQFERLSAMAAAKEPGRV